MKILAHAHTTWSMDGWLTPAEVGREAARRGFGAVLIADHVETLDGLAYRRLVDDCRAVTEAIVIPGIERSFDGYHLCAFGLTDWIDASDPVGWADAARDGGALVSCAHPIRYRNRVPERILAATDLVEVWNASRRYNGSLAPDPRAWRLVDGGRLAIASQDAHRRRDYSSVGMVIADVGTAAEVIDEIRAGRFGLVGRLVRVNGRPTGARAGLFTVVQILRPVAWAAPVAVYRLARRILRRLS